MLFVISEAEGGGEFVETRLMDRSVLNAAWSADGSLIFAYALSPTPRLVSIDWPSQNETTLLSSPWPSSDPMVAEESGTLLVSVHSGDDKEAVWRVQPGAKPEPTPVTLPSRWMELAVSPDGRYLAAVLRKVSGQGANARVTREGGLVIYGLDDGREIRVPDTAGRNIIMLRWVLAGRGVVYTVAPKGVEVYEDKAVGEQLWLVRLP
jgi:hypothetical protein